MQYVTTVDKVADIASTKALEPIWFIKLKEWLAVFKARSFNILENS